MHQEWIDLLTPYLDGELDAASHHRVRDHLAGCPECSRLLAELRQVVDWAQRYEGHAPARDPWPAIRAEIEGRKVAALPAPRWREGQFGWRQLVAAGLLMAGIGGGIGWLATRRAAPDPSAAPEQAVLMPAGLDDTDLAVRDLEQLLDSGRTRMDTATVRVVEESLRVIDRAIAEAREAIQRDSSNVYLNGRIAEHMRRKLAILRMAARAIGTQS